MRCSRSAERRVSRVDRLRCGRFSFLHFHIRFGSQLEDRLAGGTDRTELAEYWRKVRDETRIRITHKFDAHEVPRFMRKNKGGKQTNDLEIHHSLDKQTEQT